MNYTKSNRKHKKKNKHNNKSYNTSIITSNNSSSVVNNSNANSSNYNNSYSMTNILIEDEDVIVEHDEYIITNNNSDTLSIDYLEMERVIHINKWINNIYSNKIISRLIKGDKVETFGFMYNYNLDIRIRLRFYLLKLISLAFLTENNPYKNIFVYGGFPREYIKEIFNKGSGYFDSDLDISFHNFDFSSFNIKKAIEFLRLCNLNFKLIKFDNNVLSILFKFDFNDETFNVSVDFVFIINTINICDFDVNNIKMVFDTKKNTSTYIDLLLQSYIKDENLEFIVDDVRYQNKLDVLNNILELYTKVDTITYSEILNNCIDAIKNNTATLLWDEYGIFYNATYPHTRSKNLDMSKWYLLRINKIHKRGYNIIGTYPEFYNTINNNDKCPICLCEDNEYYDDTDRIEDINYIKTSCCNKYIHSSCLLDLININKSIYSYNKFTCPLCRCNTASIILTTIYDTDIVFSTSIIDLKIINKAIDEIMNSLNINNSAYYQRIRDNSININSYRSYTGYG